MVEWIWAIVIAGFIVIFAIVYVGYVWLTIRRASMPSLEDCDIIKTEYWPEPTHPFVLEMEDKKAGA